MSGIIKMGTTSMESKPAEVIDKYLHRRGVPWLFMFMVCVGVRVELGGSWNWSGERREETKVRAAVCCWLFSFFWDGISYQTHASTMYLRYQEATKTKDLCLPLPTWVKARVVWSMPLLHYCNSYNIYSWSGAVGFAVWSRSAHVMNDTTWVLFDIN